MRTRYHPRVAACRLAIACGMFVAAFACAANGFVCENDDECVAGETLGMCEPSGGCSFPDDACPSGRRYGDRSKPGLAGTCVDEDAGSSSSSTTGASATTSAAETLTTLDATTAFETGASESSTAAGTSSTSSSSDGPATCPTDWWDCGWTRRVELTIAPVAEPATDVPVLVRLDAGRIDWASASAAGEDLRFVADGTVLPHELEAWSAGESAIVWVRVPAIGGDAPTRLWLYHGNPEAADGQDPEVVWTAPFVGVWHLSGSANDSTTFGNHGAESKGVMDAAGWLSGGQQFFAVEDRIDVAAAASLADVLMDGGTVSAWVRLDGWGGTNRGRVADKTGGAAGGWMFYTSSDSGGELRWRYGYAENQSIWQTEGGTIALDTWHFVAATFAAEDGLPPRLYIDGVEQAVAQDGAVPLGAPVGDTDLDLVIGNSDVPDRWFEGTIDELRVEHTQRGPDWIALQSQSMRDELLAYGAIERLEDLQ